MPTLRASTPGVNQGGAGTITVNKPAGTIQYDVMIASLLSGSTTVHPVLAGWTEISFQSDAVNGTNLTVLRKVAGAAEGASYAFTGTSLINGTIATYVGVDNVTPEDAPPLHATGLGVSVIAPDITSVTSGALLVDVFATSGNATTLSLPTGFTNDVAAFGALGDIMRVDHKLLTTSGPTGTATSTQDDASGTDAWLTTSILLRPAPTPVVVDVTESVFDADTTTHLVSMPAANVGELLVAIFANDDVTGVFTPVGWSLIGGASGAAGTSSCRVYGRVADGTESATNFQTNSAEVAVAQVYRFTNWRGGNPLTTNDIAIATATGTASINANPPSLTPGWIANNIWIAVANLDNRSSGANTPPANYTNMIYTEAPLAVNRTCLFSARRELAAATEDPGTYTTAGSQAWVGITIAIRPSVQGPTDSGSAQIVGPIALLGGPWMAGTPILWESVDTTIPVSVENTTPSDVDAGVGTEDTQVTGNPVSADSGVGTEGTFVLGLPADVDSGTGSESVVTTGNVPAPNTGAGTEAFSVIGTIPASDTAVGTESTTTSGSVPASDSGVGTESVVYAASYVVGDSGVGTETTSYTSSVAPNDSGVGTESTSTTGAVTATESGAGTESIAIQGFYITSDAGVGTESVATSVAAVGADSGTGTEATSTTAAVPTSNTGSGTETVSTTAIVGNTDNGGGSEATSTLAVVGLGDSGSGTESASTAVAVPASNTGAGTESVTTTGSVPTTDSATGSDTFTVLGLVGASNSGVGSESTAVTGPGAGAQIAVTDSGVGTESVSIVVTGILGGYIEPGISREPRIRTELEKKPIPPRYVSVTDSGSGDELAALGFARVVSVWDRGQGTEFASTPFHSWNDSGKGTEFTSIMKVEDPDSELKTIHFMGEAGVLTPVEYALLLDDHLRRRTR